VSILVVGETIITQLLLCIYLYTTNFKIRQPTSLFTINFQ